MELCEKEEYRGCTINVYYDEIPEDPRTWCNVATFVCEHRRYTLGDEQDIEGRIDSLFNDYVPAKAIIDHFVKTRDAHLVPGDEDDYCDQYYEYKETVCGKEYTRYIDADTSDSEDSIASDMTDQLDMCEKMLLLENTGEVVTLPISMYEHSGISLWLGSKWCHPDAQWDCSSIGFAYVEKKTAKEEGMLDPGDEYEHDWKKWAYAMMDGEMETYNKYVSGEVYGYMIEDYEEDELEEWRKEKSISLSDLTNEQLQQLRSEIVVGSMYLSDYENSFNINENEVYDISESYDIWCEENGVEDNAENFADYVQNHL